MVVMLPLQGFDPSKLIMENPKRIKSSQPNIERTLSIFSYKNDTFTMSSLHLLTPFGKVHTWDYSTGKLEIDIGAKSVFHTKYTLFQSTITMLIKKLYPTESYFHPMLFGSILTVYLYTKPPFQEKETLLYSNSTWSSKLQKNTFEKGQSIRLGIQFQGVCFLHNLQLNDCKYRLQHQVKAIYFQGPPKTETSHSQPES
jgi:hypothetical protein